MQLTKNKMLIQGFNPDGLMYNTVEETNRGERPVTRLYDEMRIKVEKNNDDKSKLILSMGDKRIMLEANDLLKVYHWVKE